MARNIVLQISGRDEMSLHTSLLAILKRASEDIFVGGYRRWWKGARGVVRRVELEGATTNFLFAQGPGAWE